MYLYTLCTPETGEVRYVGITILERPRDRFRQHMHQANKGTKSHLYNWIRSLHVEPDFKVIAQASSYDELKQMEIATIKEMKVQGLPLTNQTEGGDGTLGFSRRGKKSYIPSQETKDRIAQTLKGQGAGENNPFYGKKHSEETRKRMSEKRKVRITTAETKEKMRQAQLRRYNK
jgi:hypothetical protein